MRRRSGQWLQTGLHFLLNSPPDPGRSSGEPRPGGPNLAADAQAWGGTNLAADAQAWGRVQTWQLMLRPGGGSIPGGGGETGGGIGGILGLLKVFA